MGEAGSDKVGLMIATSISFCHAPEFQNAV
jgi:hypothetical protein